MSKNILILLLVVVVIVLGIFLFANYQQKGLLIDNDGLETTPSPSPLNTTMVTASEESSNEVFKNQPGAITSIKPNGIGGAELEIDLLTRNPKWIPGDDSSGGFFINQSTKVRSLLVTTNAKMYICGSGPSGEGPMSNTLIDTAKFFADNKTIFDQRRSDMPPFGVFGYTAYFDINGSNITAIYQQCLP